MLLMSSKTLTSLEDLQSVVAFAEAAQVEGFEYFCDVDALKQEMIVEVRGQQSVAIDMVRLWNIMHANPAAMVSGPKPANHSYHSCHLLSCGAVACSCSSSLQYALVFFMYACHFVQKPFLATELIFVGIAGA